MFQAMAAISLQVQNPHARGGRGQPHREEDESPVTGSIAAGAAHGKSGQNFP